MAHWNGSLLFTGSSDEDPQREQEPVLALWPGGSTASSSSPPRRPSLPLPEIAAGVASVFVDLPAGMIEADAVRPTTPRDPSGVTDVIQHGHQRIGFIGDDVSIHTASHRERGHREADGAGLRPGARPWVARIEAAPASVQARAGPSHDPDRQPVTAASAGKTGSRCWRCGRSPGRAQRIALSVSTTSSWLTWWTRA